MKCSIEGKLSSALWFCPTVFLYLECSGEKEYYEKQFATLQSFEEVESLDSPHVINDEDQDRSLQARHERAMKISNWANIILLAFKVSLFLGTKDCSCSV